MKKVAIVGPHKGTERAAISSLLFTDVGFETIRFETVDKLLEARNRPDLDLIVLMAGVDCKNMQALQKTLKTPVLHLTVGSKRLNVEIQNHVAIVELMNVEEAKDQRVRFAIAAGRRSSWKSEDRDWPTKLVPDEFLKPAPHPRP